ncbi:ATPase [Actinorhabdospora filicis]|uniref:ATPase n=1 Tax=Actinorhabdospora filicis TaxID=1785913 RepID=A0A9W6SNZ6_9ACTN|nr:cation-translocating P-type ATPase [Actinorhabdospora filicis]GLZ78086.1 ATPase [Actinorhabdospora filicis]
MDTVTTTRRGLTTGEAARLLAATGPNTIPAPRPPRLAARVAAQLIDPLVTLLLAAALVTSLLGDWTDALVIALVITLNTAIGVAQQTRADKAVAALGDLTAPIAHVVRDGRDTSVPAADLVPGDLVRLAAGDVVPADLTLTAAHRCQLDESALTGESLPAERVSGEAVEAGTVVVAGRAEGVVTRTGAGSAMGRVAGLVAAASGRATPLQRRIARLGRILSAAVVLLCAIVFALGVASGTPWLTMALIAVSLAVAAVPESLPAVVTLALALGARRMARHNAIPRSLHAVETLGSVTVIASDKTGTLTQGRMSVRAAVPVRGGPAGLARAAVLCSDATLDEDGRATGDAMEAALLTHLAGLGLDAETVRSGAPRLAEVPFDQATRRMVTVHDTPSGPLTVCKGAPETVLAAPVTDPGDPDVAAALAEAERLAARGLRVIAVAAGPGTEAAGLGVLGVIGIGDPLRGDAAQVAEAIGRAGIRLDLITGDHPATAAAIAAELGIAGDDRVHARIRPEGKLDIIAALQESGHIVAMTGDGVNDAPALRRADIGVAMGGGTEVARRAADLVLADDSLGTVVTAVGEGRRVYDNIRRFLLYGLAGGTAEILVMLAGPLFGLAVPLLPAQILWINLLTHGLPGVALGAEPAEPGVLRRPPRAPGEQILGAGLWRGVLAIGVLLTIATLGSALAAGDAWRSALFTTLGLAQLGIALALRPRGAGRRNPGLLLAVVLSAGAQIAAVTWGPLRTLMGAEPLTAGRLAVCAALAAGPALAVLIYRKVRQR